MTEESSNYRPFIGSERLLLREVRVEDAHGAYYHWMNDPEITQYLESRFTPHSVEQLEEFVRGVQKDRRNIFLAIVLRESQQHIGNIKLGPIDWNHRMADIGIVLGERSCWGKGIATEAIALISQYAFDVLNLRKLNAGCYATNGGSVRALEKAGFHVEAVRKAHYFSHGSYVDAIQLSRFRPEA